MGEAQPLSWRNLQSDGGALSELFLAGGRAPLCRKGHSETAHWLTSGKELSRAVSFELLHHPRAKPAWNWPSCLTDGETEAPEEKWQG